MIFKMQYSPWTQYEPNCSYNAFLQQKYHTGNSHEYRYFLQQNADSLRHSFQKCAYNTATLSSCYEEPSKWKPANQSFYR